MQFINEKIRTIFAYEDKKILKEKKIFKLKRNQLISSKTDYNKDFLEKTLGVIFSGDISSCILCNSSFDNNFNFLAELLPNKLAAALIAKLRNPEIFIK